MSHFSALPGFPPDPIFGLTSAFLLDKRENTVNLGIGIYRNESLETPVMACVKKAEVKLIETETSKNYLPVEGDPVFCELSASSVLGDFLYKTHKDRITVAQTLGGTGALRSGAEILVSAGKKRIHIPDPSWSNHKGVFTRCGLEVKYYPYYNTLTGLADISKMKEYLSRLPEGEVVLFHCSCHNPTGADLDKADWRDLVKLCVEKKLIPFFDAAYLGFDLSFEDDSFSIRLFIENEVEVFLSVSFSKNLGLYGERIGFFLSFSKQKTKERILSCCKEFIRRNYSNPPLRGAKIVTKILLEPELKKLWNEELAEMRERITEMRKGLVRALSLAGSMKDYSYLLSKKGLFSFSGLSPVQVARLPREYGIYMTSDGRMNLAGLNQKNISFVANAIVEVGGIK